VAAAAAAAGLPGAPPFGLPPGFPLPPGAPPFENGAYRPPFDPHAALRHPLGIPPGPPGGKP